MTLSRLLDSMQQRLCDRFNDRHRLNVNHTRSVWNQVEKFLENNAVVKIQDFSENYTCLLPKDVVTALESGTMYSTPSSCIKKCWQ